LYSPDPIITNTIKVRGGGEMHKDSQISKGEKRSSRIISKTVKAASNISPCRPHVLTALAWD